ncbi:MAG: hypothetical protein JNM19_10755, partial [Chitinophagaceae bacterium]|nr:hypothetical protein [Chitinophagaceae bacterium]
IGEVSLLEQWTESDGNRSVISYTIDVPVTGTYTLSIVSNLQQGATLPITLDNKPTSLRIIATETGWQKTAVTVTAKNELGLYMSAGRHTISLSNIGNVPPLVDDLSFSRSVSHPALDASWQRFSQQLNQLLQEKPATNKPAADKYESSLTEKVLSNPEGNYDHAIDTAFTYSTFQFVYLTAGTTYTFSTSGSTKDPVLHLFYSTDIDNRSWSSDDYNGTWESNLVVNITSTGTYCLLVRPYYASQSGITTILQNGVTLLANTPIAGQRFATTPRTGDLNYFTAKLTGASNPDTRLFTLPSTSGKVTGYNDDYNNNNDGYWGWGFSSRIKKNYAAGSSIVYVCAYSATRTGSCDVYMGNIAASLPTSGEAENFPLLKGEDAIQSAPYDFDYNCIAWSGGITNNWIWPPSSLSTYNCGNANLLECFDNFYKNNPIRYPGAWNY